LAAFFCASSVAAAAFAAFSLAIRALDLAAYISSSIAALASSVFNLSFSAFSSAS